MMHVNPNQELPAHLAAYPNPMAEKQKVEEYIKLIRHERFEGSLSIPCWEWTRPPVRKRSHNNLFLGKNLRMGDMKRSIRIERERERERERGTKRYFLLSKCNSYNNEQPTFTKGYKATLYSDSLRATALYAIYTNGPNLGYQRG